MEEISQRVLEYMKLRYCFNCNKVTTDNHVCIKPRPTITDPNGEGHFFTCSSGDMTNEMLDFYKYWNPEVYNENDWEEQ